MSLKIELITESASWMHPYTMRLANSLRDHGHDAYVADFPGTDRIDIAFFLSYGKLVANAVLQRAKNNIVVHGSDLPEGKGWSPWSWQILEGERSLCLTLFEAKEKVDSGTVYMKSWVELTGHELVGEWQEKQALETLRMCETFVLNYPGIVEKGQEQVGTETFYKKRNSFDSEIDVKKSIEEQFNLLRIVDNERYPAYFHYNGKKYIIKIQADEENGK